MNDTGQQQPAVSGAPPPPAAAAGRRGRRVRCLNPFRWMEVIRGGEVTPCCACWFKGSLGNIREQSPEEIWNSPAYQEVRAAMYEGGDWARFCNAQTCPQIFNDQWVWIDEITPDTKDSQPITREFLEDIRAGRTQMTCPPAVVGVSCDSRCNLRCVMCPTVNDRGGGGALLQRALDGVRAMMPGIRRIKLMGDGEVFAVPESRQFLFDFDPQRHPETAFLIHTNGTLLDAPMWEKIERVPIGLLVVSVDAACAQTYEKIHRGANWETTRRNLELMAGRRRAGRIGEFQLSMCVMKSNHRELVDFARLGMDLGADRVYYIQVLGDCGEEQIFWRHDAPCLHRIAVQLRDPFMSRPGIDTNALDPVKRWKPGLRDWIRILRNR